MVLKLIIKVMMEREEEFLTNFRDDYEEILQ